jgi:hypothetical protein
MDHQRDSLEQNAIIRLVHHRIALLYNNTSAIDVFEGNQAVAETGCLDTTA